MIQPLNETHDPALRSWVESANAPGTDFPIQNLPFGVFRRAGTADEPKIGVAIGDQIADLRRSAELGLFEGLPAAVIAGVRASTLNALMAVGRTELSQLRRRLARMLAAGGPGADSRILVPMARAELQVPAAIGNYTDFYASVFHATNVGRLFRPDNPLLPNFKHVPIAYHGRSSSIVVSGTPVRRPSGQSKGSHAGPVFGPSTRLDYEVEVGCFAGPGNQLGRPIPIDEAEAHIFGLCLVNDWSARDIQAWEYQPLGPFLSKSFATTVSPWVVTCDALAPFRAPAFARPAGDPAPLPYLQSAAAQTSGGFDVTIEAALRTGAMRKHGDAPAVLSRSSLRDMYWTFSQMVAHHTSNGCNLVAGDLLASGTVSGPGTGAQGCLLELTEGGKTPLALPDGERRTFLEDGDEVIFRARCEREGFVGIGFGACTGVIV